MAIAVELHGRTDVGQVREHNEDAYVVVRLEDDQREVDKLRQHDLGARGTLLVVCDGMGGAAAGEVASSMAVEAIGAVMLGQEKFAPPAGVTDDEKQSLARKLRQSAREANARIFREARENVTRAGMGTTMTAALLWKDHALIAQVGDSRCYVWRQGKFSTQVTRDQSLVNQLLESGHITAEQAKFFEHSNVILQALGVQEDVEVQLSRVELRRGDRLLLCSDRPGGRGHRRRRSARWWRGVADPAECIAHSCARWPTPPAAPTTSPASSPTWAATSCPSPPTPTRSSTSCGASSRRRRRSRSRWSRRASRSSIRSRATEIRLEHGEDSEPELAAPPRNATLELVSTWRWSSG